MSDSKPVPTWQEQMKQDQELSGTFHLKPVCHGLAAAGALFISYSLHPYSDTAAELCTGHRLLHLASFAANFGAQIWVTFIAGQVMLRSMPRHIFGHVQSRMFPTFFTFGMVTNSITLSTYLLMHPRGSWGPSEKTQIMALGTMLMASVANAYFLTPGSVHTMWEMYKMEHEMGYGNQIGMVYPDAKEHPEYGQVQRRFRIWHSVSMLASLAGFVGAGTHLYYLASRLSF